MKSSLLLVILLFSGILASAQVPPCQWAKGFGSAAEYNGSGMTTDASGNVYVTGFFTDSILVFGNDTLINSATNGARNMFLAKYDSFGNPVWARSAGGGADEGTENVEAFGVGADANGNAYVLGYFETPIVIFGNDTLVTNNYNSFLVKYNSQGNAVWAINMGGTLNNAQNIVVDAKGNSYIAGYFTSGNIIGGTDTVPMSGYVEAFAIKYDSSGNSLWAAGISGGEVLNYGVAIDAASNIYVTGGYTGDTALVSNTITLTNTGASGMYTVKYEAAGNVAWAENVSVSGDIFSTGISADARGNVYITGNTSSDTLVFGTDTAFTGATQALDNFFVAAYDSSGNARWAHCTAGYNDVLSSGISADADGNVYVTGNFEYSSIVIGNDTLVNNDTLDADQALFITKFDSAGNNIWAIGGLTPKADIDGGVAIEADNKGHLYVSGSYQGPSVIFGADTLPYSVSEGYQSNVFVAKYSVPQTITGIAKPLQVVNAISVYPNPSAGLFYFKGINNNSTLEVYDLLGRLIYSTITTDDNYLLNLSTQAKGIYLYRVVDANASMQQGKIILE